MNAEILCKIKNALGLKSHITPYKWAKRINTIQPKHAKKLEQLTGISRLKFMYPDEFGDPWDEVKTKLK